MIVIEYTRPKKGDTYTLLFDKESYDLYKKHTWKLITCNKKMYLARQKNNKTILFHRQLLNLSECNKDVVDHMDSNTLNNQLSNLRICSVSDNNRNRVQKSFTKGYYFNKQRNCWQAQIRINGKRIYLGRFKDEFMAKEAYIQECTKLGLLFVGEQDHPEKLLNKISSQNKELSNV